MSNEKKQEYTLKITRANKTQLIVILYEMALTYMEEAREVAGSGTPQEFQRALSRCRACIDELIASLNFEYEIAIRLLQLYMFVNKELARAKIRRESEHLDNAARIITALLLTYHELSEMDDSLPVMENAEIVYSGLTYDRRRTLESLSNSADRGFRV